VIQLITVSEGWQRYAGSEQGAPIEPGEYYSVQVRKPKSKDPETLKNWDKFRNSLCLVPAKPPTGGFCWLAPAEPWVKQVLLGRLNQPIHRADPNSIDWEMLRVGPDDLRDWQRDFVCQAWAAVTAGRRFHRVGHVSLGGGKTLAGLMLLAMGETGVVLAPRHVHETWRTEAEKWGYQPPTISTYESAHRLMSLKPDVVIADECFPKGTLVEVVKEETVYQKNIEDISVGETVVSSNSEGVLCERKVSGVLVKRSSHDIITLKHEFGEVSCTSNHPIWTEESGYVEARYCVGKTLRVLWSTDTAEKAHFSVLQQILFSKMEGEVAPHHQTVKREYEEEPPKGVCRLHGEIARGTFEPQDVGEATFERNQSQDAPASQDKQAQSSGWQRNRPDQGRTGNGEVVACGRPPCTRNELDCGSASSDNSSVPYADTLQSGLGISRSENRYRNRWWVTLQPEAPGNGSEERPSVVYSRVESISVSEQRGNAAMGKGETVYCIAVEDTNCFFADGVLVHNCHLCKNSTTNRHQHAAALCDLATIAVGFTASLMGGGGPFDLRSLRVIVPGSVPASETAWRFLFGLDTELKEVAPGRQAWVTNTWDTAKISEFVAPHVETVDTSHLLSQLPPITEQIVTLPQPNEYKSIQAGVATTRNKSKLTAQLRQCTDGFVAMDDGSIVPMMTNPKLRWIEEFVEHLGEPVVIYAAWQESVASLSRALSTYQPSVIEGATGDVDYQIERFKTGQTRVLIANAAYSAGMNLQGVCRTMVFMSLSSNPVNLTQSIGRIHRPGQTRGCQVLYLQCEETIDQRAYELITKHQELSEDQVEKLLAESC